MKKRHKRKKLLKPKGSCGYARCIQPAIIENPNEKILGPRCEKHRSWPQPFQKQSKNVIIESSKEGDYEIMKSLTPLGRLFALFILILGVVGIGITFIYQQKQIDKLQKPITVIQRIIVTQPPIPTASISATPKVMQRASSLQYSVTKGIR